ncbi:MAG TPA: hypothetical protein VLY63_21025 [Anaerolineae bacterium]|nr:hypothetical protein [Anaerolineae bacterium]
MAMTSRLEIKLRKPVTMDQEWSIVDELAHCRSRSHKLRKDLAGRLATSISAYRERA